MPAKKIHILVAPLDWGIGHATRCVPVIRMLLQKGVEITLAAGGQPLAFLKLTFPEVNVIESEGLNVTYPDKGSMAIKMALSTPRFLAEIYREHRSLENLVKEYGFDAVISDNRFGFWSSKVPSVYLTHQVAIRMPKTMKALEPLIYYIHGLIIKQYTECWIPDASGDINLSGALSHGHKKPGNASFIGPLTRFKDFSHTMDLHDKRDEFDLLVMLSGPEPQRSIFEGIIRMEVKKHPELKVAMLQGMPGRSGIQEEQDGLMVYSHLPDHRIASMIRNARMIVCRPGYSTVMDLASLKKTAIFVPTPGQTEQEYLGEYLKEKNWFHCIRQENLTINKIMETSKKATLSLPDIEQHGLLEERVDNLLVSLGKPLTDG